MSPAQRLSQPLSSNIGRRLFGLALSLTLGLVFTGGLFWLVNRSAQVVRAEPVAAKAAAPEGVGTTSRVQVGGRQVEGWVSVGGYEVLVTLKDGAGAVKAAQTVWPDAQLHFQVGLTATILAGDHVEVSAGGVTTVIVVEGLTAQVDFEQDRIVGTGPAGAILDIQAYHGYSAYTQTVTVDGTGQYTVGNPFFSYGWVGAIDLEPGDYGEVRYNRADSNQVYRVFGQFIHVYANSNRVLGYALQQNIPVSITLLGPDNSVKRACTVSSSGVQGTYQAFFTLESPECYGGWGGETPIIIQPGDSVVVSIEGITTTVPIPLLTATPNLATDVLAGVAPPSSGLRATLDQCTNPTNGRPCTQRTTSDAAGIYAVGPFTYTAWTGSGDETRNFDIVPGNTGKVEYTNPDGNIVDIAYAATGSATTLASGGLRDGAAGVMGTAVAGAAVEIWDSTSNLRIGVGTAGTDGRFTIAVNPRLAAGHTIVAIANGLPSVPQLVGRAVTILGPVVSVTETVGFHGIAPAGTTLEIREGGTLVVSTTVGADGHWATVATLTAGTHVLTAGALETGQTSSSITVGVDPTAVSIGGSTGTVGGTTQTSTPSGQNHLEVRGGARPITVTVEVLNNPCTVTISFMGQTITPTAGIIPSSQVTHTVVFSNYAWQTGTHEVMVNAVSCGGTPIQQPVAEVTLIDPSGYIYDSATSERIKGAMVTCYYSDTVKGQWVVWEAGLYNNQLNPQSTDEEGRYGFMVPPGDYYVTASKPGYAGNQTIVYAIPPEVDYAHIPLTRLVGPSVNVSKSSEGALLTWAHLGAGVRHYEVYRSTAPYFATGGPYGQKLDDVPLPDDGSQVGFLDTEAFKSPPTNYFYSVLAVDGSGQTSPASNRTATFNFVVQPGTP